MSILDPSLIGELAAVVTTTMQSIKAHPKIKGSMIPWFSAVFGALAGLVWFLVGGKLDDGSGWFHVDWANIFRGTFNGVAASVAANGTYNIQKLLPLPNILPTASELDAQKLKEEVKTNDLVTQAVEQGIPPEDAKEAVGREPDDPPPVEQTPVETPPPAATPSATTEEKPVG